jgi:UDP-3-O-[3-hydroxymyristoyl] glucosamine N-acyltransferase
MISPLSQISDQAQLGANVTVHPFSTIFEDVIIGDNSVIHPNVTIYPGTRIGHDCVIYPGAVIGVIASQKANSSQNFVFKFEKIMYKFFSIFSKIKILLKN